MEINEDRYYDRYDEDPPRRKRRGCECGLDGYPGHCPGPENCPYADHGDNEDEDND